MELVTDLTQPQYLALARIVVAETPRDPSLPELFREAIAGRVLSGVVSMVAAGQRAGLVEADVDAPPPREPSLARCSRTCCWTDCSGRRPRFAGLAPRPSMPRRFSSAESSAR